MILLGELFGRKNSSGCTLFCAHCGPFQDGLLPIPEKGRLPGLDTPESADADGQFCRQMGRSPCRGKLKVRTLPKPVSTR